MSEAIKRSKDMIGKKVENLPVLSKPVVPFDVFDKFVPYCIKWEKIKKPFKIGYSEGGLIA